jgi:CubicO group peptidase (beta-lactamase class C family)
MNIKRIIILSLLAVVTLALIVLGPLAWKITAGLRTPVQAPEPDYWPTQGWQTSTPEEQGFDSAKMAQGLLAMQENQAPIDSLLIIRNGYVVLDAHFEPYDGSFPHDIASVTKSVMTTLIAIAAEQSNLDLDQPVISYFPERTIANLDERKARLTVRHLTGMVNGMESGCYEGDDSTLQAMRSNPDWVQAALDRPMVAEPGTQFCYDSPGMHLLSAVLQQATGMTALDFARQYLFEPLGIQGAIWDIDPQGYSRGWGDLHLLPEDLAKIGFLWLQRGNWDGQQIVSEAWVLDSVKTHSKNAGPDYGYGYGWWISMGDYQGSGRGGQRVRVMSSVNTILVATGVYYEYSDIEDWLLPMLLTLKDSRPANPEGLAALEATLSSVAQQDARWDASYTPGTAAAVSGKTYACESNPANIESVRVDFDSSDQATIRLKMAGADFVLPIGLDGRYRQNSEGWGYRGYWEDAHTFHFEGFDIGLLNRQVLFDGDELQISLPEAELRVVCQVQEP